MDSTANDFRMAFETALVEHGYTFKVDSGNLYSITQVDKSNQKVTAKLICSEPIDERKHGTKNDTEVKAIGYFLIDLSHGAMQADFYSFSFFNANDNKVEFVIVPTDELKNRLSERKRIIDNKQKVELKLWLLPDGYVFDATDIGAETEWYFIAGRMAVNTVWDFTLFLNQWNYIQFP